MNAVDREIHHFPTQKAVKYSILSSKHLSLQQCLLHNDEVQHIHTNKNFHYSSFLKSLPKMKKKYHHLPVTKKMKMTPH